MVPGYLLALREGLEAALVIGILFSVLAKMEQKSLGRTIWFGVICGAAISLLTALALNYIGMSFEGRGEQMFEGITMLTAAGILTWMVFWMRKQSGAMTMKIESTLKQSVEGQGKGAIFLLAFLAVVREGIELALFLLAIRLESNPLQQFLGALFGLLSAALIGVIVFRSAQKLSLKRFFQATNILLALFAAGLIGLGIHEFNELGWIPALIEPVWNLSSFLSDESPLGGILKAMVGYTSSPSLTMVMGYISYFLVLAVIITLRRKRAIVNRM